MVDADKAVEEFRCHVHGAHRLLRADEMSMRRWSLRVKDSIHLWEMEMKMLLSDVKFEADDVRFVLVLEGQFTCKPESRSQKVELCCEDQLVKRRSLPALAPLAPSDQFRTETVDGDRYVQVLLPDVLPRVVPTFCLGLQPSRTSRYRSSLLLPRVTRG